MSEPNGDLQTMDLHVRVGLLNSLDTLTNGTHMYRVSWI